MERSSGVLLNISSLPSQYGIGGFGKEIEDFCSFLKKGAFKVWQILPITAIGLGDSPYSGASAFALNYLYIDPQMMKNDGLIDEETRAQSEIFGQDYCVDYAKVYFSKNNLLKKAYETNQYQIKDKLIDFLNQHKWVKSYAMFMALKKLHNGIEWWKWDSKYVIYNQIDFAEFEKNYSYDLYFYVFEQYVCNIQWERAREVCKKNQIKIVGDMPMYVSLDSVEVWETPKNFLLEKDFCPKQVAGVPPDYFCEDGQLWGNPLYDYDFMRKDNFSWWLNRFDRMMELYDVLRIDHFRAFSQFWAVDYGEKTAKNGKWVDGIGMELISKVLQKYNKDNFIAEDLGIIDDKVRELLKECDFYGMRVMQFGFEDGDSIHLPHNFCQDCVGYTATHDNNTTLGWLYSLPENILDYALRYVEADKNNWRNGGYNCQSTKAFIKRLIASTCKVAVVPFQDLCGYGADCRMNTPGLGQGNWTFRATIEALNNCDTQYYHYLNCLYGRNK